MELKSLFVQDDQGNKLPEATCYLYVRGTENLITGIVGVTALPLVNPFYSDKNGLIQFAAANGLYDLRVVGGNRDFRIPVQLNDVNDTVLAAQAAASKAEAARDAAVLRSGGKKDVAEGLRDTLEGESFAVQSPNADEYTILYTKTNGLPVEQKRFPSTKAIDTLRNTMLTAERFDDGIASGLTDENGVPLLSFNDRGAMLIGDTWFEVSNDEDYGTPILFPIYDSAGTVLDGYDLKTGESYAIPKVFGLLNNRMKKLEAIEASNASLYDSIYPKAAVAGLSIDLAGTVLQYDGKSFEVTGTVSLDPVSVKSVLTDSSQLIQYNTLTTLVDGQDFIGKYRRVKNLSNIVVTRVSDMTVLTKDVDYRVSADGEVGTLTGINSNAASTTVSIGFNYRPERCDCIAIHPDIMQINVYKGVERNVDCHEDFYRGKPASGYIPLYYAYVYGDTVQLVDASRWQEGFPGTRYSAEFTAIHAQAQRALSRVIGKLHRGQAINLAGYGDSITAQGNGTFYDYTPNGIHRDRMEHYGSYPYETQLEAGLYDLGDGEGKVHVQTGFNWTLKRHLEKRYGVSVTYNNFGIGGTTSANTTGHGLFPARINALLASAPDLTVVCFGMNELGGATTYANVRSIVEQLLAAGSDVIIMGVPRKCGRDTTIENLAAWMKTNRALRRVAIDTGVAFAPVLQAVNDDALGYIGIHQRFLCSTNFINHPGYRELELYGQLLSSLF